jgi:transposase-like protein
MRRKKFKTTQEMYPLIESYLESGQSQAQFCKEQNLKPHLLIYWLQRYKADKEGSASPEAGFSKLNIIDMPGSEDKMIIIRCGNGTTIEIPL